MRTGTIAAVAAAALAVPASAGEPRGVITEAGTVAYRGADGSVRAARRVILTKPLCTHGAPSPDEDSLRAAGAEAAARASGLAEPLEVIVGTGADASRGLAGPIVVFNVLTPAPAGASAVLQTVATTYAQAFDNTATIVLNISFIDTGFGSASTTLFFLPYTDTRAFLNAASDADDAAQALLPFGGLPIVDILGGAVRTATTAIVSSSLGKAWGAGPTAAVDADLVIGTDAPGDGRLDFFPQDGVTTGQFSALDVIAHEVGHALGFLSSVGRFAEPVPLDFFRFRAADAPSSGPAFGSTPRFFDNRFAVNTQHVFTNLTSTAGLSNNSNFQSSHWLDRDLDPIGIMDPRLTSGSTLGPALLTAADLAAFDAIGWRRVAPPPPPCNLADLAPALATLDVNDVIAFVNAFNAGAAAADVAPPAGDGVLNVNDLVAFVNAFNGGCPG